MEQGTQNILLAAAQRGDGTAREQLLLAYKPYVAKVAAEKCGRSLDWSNDDELSIALMAFNSAIDKYDPTSGTNFATFAALLIRHRLIDYFRQESKHRHLMLSQVTQEGNYLPGELEKAEITHQNKLLQENRRDELLLFSQLLAQYSITLEDLCQSSPKHQDTKLNLANIAKTIIEHQELLHKLQSSKLLPIKELVQLTGFSRKVLESGRRYIIALTIILSHELHHLRTFIQLPNEKEVSHRG